MRSIGLRFAAFATIVAALGVTLVSVPRRVTAQPVQVQIAPPGIVGTSPEGEAPVIEQLSFPENRDTSRKFEAVQEYLAQKNPKWREVCELAQGLLDAKSDYFYQFPDGDRRRVSVKDEISRMIGKLPKEGLDFYQITFGPAAESLLTEAKTDGYDKAKLAEVSQRFFHTKAGAEATLALATLNLQAGKFAEAAYGYKRMLDRPNADDLLDPKTLFRAAVAIRRAGDGKMTDAVADVWGRLEKKFPREGLQIGRQAYSLDGLKAELDKPVEMLLGSVGDQFIAMKGGNPTRAALAEAGTPFLGTVFSLPVLYRAEGPEQKEAANWVKAGIDKAYRDSKTNKSVPPMIPAAFPVTAPNVIVFRGYDGVYAFYTRDFVDASGKQRLAGDLAWHQLGQYGAASIRSNPPKETDLANLNTWWETFWQGAQPSVLFENPLAGSLSHDGKRVYFVDDFHVPPAAQVVNNQFGGFPGGNPAMTNRGMGGMRECNRLVAVDLETGLIAWHLGRPSSSTQPVEPDQIADSHQLGEGAYFLGPPVTLNGKLYALIERDGHLLLACLDGYKMSLPVSAAEKDKETAQFKPELLWLQNLGRANSPVSQDPVRRIQGAFLAAADGVIVCPTNSGAVVAVDVNARSLLWAHTYAADTSGGTPTTRNGRIIRRGGMVIQTPQQVGQNRWRSSTPLIANGRVVVSAYDSGAVQCLDLRTGRLLWQEGRKADDLYVGGLIRDAVLIVGRNSVRAVKLVGEADEQAGAEKATPAWPEEVKIALPIGHGVAGKDGHYYIPVLGDPENGDDQTAAVWDINTATRKVAKTPYRRKGVTTLGPASDPRLSLGNLVFHDGMMFSQSATEVVAFPLNETKQREMDAILAKNPNDPDGLFSRGELKLERGELLNAVADFKLAQANNPTDVTTHKIDQKLYTAYTEILRDRFADGEQFLPEYKRLCEFTPDPDAPDYGRQREEQVRRRGLYYSLVAKGREAQGRLVDAFDHYRAYAELGEKDKLLPVPEDPNTSALSSVWASGRIDAMMRNAKDPAVRKPLEDRVAKDWAEVRAANDLDRLRKFVGVFGPYFESGREAQFLLAERLAGTNNDDDRREAQGLLLTLIGTAENDRDATTAARATAALARLLTSRGLLDDALGLYARLSVQYPDVPVQNGKTGGDLLDELVTDKQYWPALEPEQPALLTRYTAQAEQSTGRQTPASVGLDVPADALPFFKRHRVSLDGDAYSGGLLTLKVTDRVSGEVKFKANTGVQPFQNWAHNSGHPNGSMANQQLAQVNGHLLLLHLERYVFCYDLSRGQELWKVDISAQNGVPANNNLQRSVQIRQDSNSDRDLVLSIVWYNQFTGQQNTDWQFRVGCSTVLQANYAAVLTKDGLVTKDPRTGDLLWQRSGLPQASLIFGDARHVFLVEPTQTGFTSRVLRAVDGVQIPGVPEFGSLLAGASRVHAFGRQVLLFEAGGKDKPRTLRLYDLLDGKDVWARQFPNESAVFDTLDPELTGVVDADGKMQVIASRTGKTLFEASTDARVTKAHVRDEKGKFAVVKPLLMTDADRYYVFLNRDHRNINVNGMTAESNGPSPNRVRLVNGPAYAFHRATGERLWYTNDQFVNQRLFVDRFDELPCLVAFNPVHPESPNAPGGGPAVANLGIRQFGRGMGVAGAKHRVMVVDKQSGAIRVNAGLMSGQGWFQWFRHDPKTGEYEFGNSNSARLLISPVKDAKSE